MKRINTFFKGKWLLGLAIGVLSSTGLNAQEEQTSFETLGNGVKVQDNQWETLGFNKTDGNEDRFTIDNSEAKSGSKSLKVTYPAGKGGLNNSGGQDVLLMTPRNEYILSYHVKFDPDFDWGDPSKNVGGKLPGLSGGAASSNAGCSGGETCNGGNGFSVRYMWRKDGEAHIYVYDMDKPGSFPSQFALRKSDGKPFFFPKGEWIHMVMRVKVNTGSSNNGEVQVWINGTELLNKTNYKFVNNNDKVEKLLFSTFHGGSGSNWAPRRNNTAWFDDILVTTNLDDVFDNTDSDNDGVPDVIDGCPNDNQKSAPGVCGCGVSEDDCSFEEQFEDEMINTNLTGQFDGTNQLSKLNVEETPCGELKLSAKSTLGEFDPIFLTLLDPTDFSQNPVIEVRARSTEPVDIRIDLRDDVNPSNKTSTSSGKITRTVKGDPLLWQTLRFEFPAAAFTDASVDITSVKSMDIMFDAGLPGFDGDLYIDYIAFGAGLGNANSTCIDGFGTIDCAGTPGGDAYTDACNQCVGGESSLLDCSASTLFLAQFDGQGVTASGDAIALNEMVVEETGCGELKLEAGTAKRTFSTLFLNLPAPINITDNQKIIVRARATESTDFRFDFRDNVNSSRSTNKVPGNIVINFDGDNEWKIYTFDFPDGAFTVAGNEIDKTQISKVSFVPMRNQTTYNGTVWIDYVAVGQAPEGGGNADDVCVIGQDCNGDANGTAVFDVNCGECVGGNTGLGVDFCVTDVEDASETEKVELFPNPTTAIINMTKLSEWELLSIDSKVLETGKSALLDLSSYETGVYFVKIGTEVHRVVKQ